MYRVLSVSVATLLGVAPAPAQGGFPSLSEKPIAAAGKTPERIPVFEGNPGRGARPGSERWIVHFASRPFDLAAYRAEMWGGRDPRKVAGIVADLERRMRAHQSPFVEKIEGLGGRVTQQYWLVNACAIEIDPEHLGALRKLGNVVYLQPDTDAVPQAFIRTATNSSNHNADALQAQGFTGSNVGCAIIDTGHDVNMNGSGRIHVTYSRRGNTSLSRVCVQRRIGSQPFDDVHGHGTGVASIAAGWRWLSSTADSGHAYDALIAGYSIANFPSGGTSLSTEAAAYNQVAVDAAQCRIVATNLSYSGSSNPLSVEQKAMDSLALNADIVNCTAAGNRSTSVSSSLANVNGLSVGAVSENSMVLASFSSRGIQGGRYFPNMAANGVSTNMARRDNENADYIASGTSMASPQVCGAVTQIRGINTALKSDETRALMLASTFPSPGSGSTIKITGPGAGYLKNDAARDIARNAGRHGRATLDATSSTFRRSITVQQGELVQCAIAWHRHDVNSTSWSNLDLRLKRGSTVLVSSDTSLNTEEFVRYTATRNETLSLEVTLVSLGAGASSQAFGWACKQDATVEQPGKYTLFGVGCAGSGSGGPGKCTALPKAYATKMGRSANTFPHARANMRYQQVFLGSEIGGSQTWTELCLRLDETWGGPAQSQTLSVHLGPTTKNHGTLTTSFAGNYSGPRTTVFSGTVNLPQHSGGGNTSSFKVCAKFSAPYRWTASPGTNVIVEIINSSASASSHFEDFAYGASDVTTTRAYAFDRNAKTASSLLRGQGLVMCLRQAATGAIPLLTNTGVPTVGNRFTVNLSRAKQATIAILWTGKRTWIPLPTLPPGCSLYTQITALAGLVFTSSTGRGAASVWIANDPSLIGTKFANQWWIVDPANSFGLVFTNGGEGQIGR